MESHYNQTGSWLLSSLLPSSTSLLVQLCCNSPTSTMFVFSLGEVKYQIFFQVLLNIFSKCCVHVFLVGCLPGWWRLRPLPGRCWVRVVAGPQSSAHSTSPTEAGLVQPPAPSHHHPPAQPSPAHQIKAATIFRGIFHSHCNQRRCRECENLLRQYYLPSI